MALLAPYSSAMRLGQGFNAYTQDIRLDGAVKIPIKQNPSPTIPQTQRVASGLGVSNVSQRVSHFNSKDTSNLNPPSPPGTPLLNADRSSTTQIRESLLSPAQERNRTASPAPCATSILSKFASPAPFVLPESTSPPPSQTVTFSTRAISSVSDIITALNISTSTSIGHGTIHASGSASFVNESAILDAQLNYIVSVSVSNDRASSTSPLDAMEFVPIEGIPPDKFTHVFGDCFVSDFVSGGEFAAIISVSVADQRRVKEVKQAVDVQLAVGPAPVTVGVQESMSRSHAEALRDAEVTISVSWTGGGEVKRPEEAWTLETVMRVANAFPAMVARCEARTAAVLTRYEALRSWQVWKWGMVGKDPEWGRRFVVLDYTPCQLYTADLFDSLMAYKKLAVKIGEILKNPEKYKMREGAKRKLLASPSSAIKDFVPKIDTKLHLAKSSSNLSAASEAPATPLSPCEKRERGMIDRADTFQIDDSTIGESWDLFAVNHDRTPIPVEPLALNEAKLLCREAMTLITQEASRLVDHPHLAYAEFNTHTGKTQMKRPNFAYPEVLRLRLPIPIHNAAALDSSAADPSAVLTQAYARDNNLYCHLVGDPPNPHRTYKAFTSLDLNETPRGRATTSGAENPLRKLCLHSYHHHSIAWSDFDADADGAIGAIGFGFARDAPSSATSSTCQLHHYGHPSSDSSSVCKVLDLGSKSATGTADITRLDICYVPGTGRIAGLVFYDDFVDATTERLAMRQWGTVAGVKEPAGLEIVRQEPPDDGERWRFVGVCGEMDSSVWGEVLGRVSGVWRRE